MDEPSEDLPHLYAEGIEYSKSTIPEAIGYAFGELDQLAEEQETVDRSNEVLHLYRGDSRENLESIGADMDNKTAPNGLSKDFPLYFTTSEEEARDHASRKPVDETYLIELAVPFDSLDRIEGYSPREVASNYDEIDFEEGTMYFNQANTLRSTLEWVATDIPSDWVEDIEELE